MSALSTPAIHEFQKIYRAENGVNLSSAEATAQAHVFIAMFEKIYRPLKKDWSEQLLDTPTLA